MQCYLAAVPEQVQEAGRFGCGIAHVAYRIGSGSILLRSALSLQVQGGLLCVSDRDAPTITDPGALCAAVNRECGRRGYSGVLLDFESPLRPDLLSFAKTLTQQLSSHGRTLYLPEEYAQAADGDTVILICTAISGGSLSQRLKEAAEHFGGAARLGLDIQRLRMDFRLPERSGQGTLLSEAQLRQLMEPASVFFSQELCARYFTYTKENSLHFVLFDDAGTITQKLRLGAGMGFRAAFLMWPEVQDIAPKLNLGRI